ncbi:hypothetical protein [Micromonospora globbae]|uniref:hypothetical protein n=1 Tax=Micromonospora globbae TaxID=1894969 RepID=UPI00342451C6
MENPRPGAGPGAGATTAGEHVTTTLTDRPDNSVARRGGDPVIARRRAAGRLDDLLGGSRRREPEPYAAGGMTLDWLEREDAAPAPLGCAA